MPRPKCPDGVLATIERLTGQDPCPGYLRDKLNHYLDQNELFSPTPGHKEATLADKLDPPRTDILVMNVLNLDQVFLSKTKLITKLVNRTAARAEIEKAITTTKAEMQRRFDTYGYWLHRLDSLKTILTDPAIDLRAQAHAEWCGGWRIRRELFLYNANDDARTHPLTRRRRHDG